MNYQGVLVTKLNKLFNNTCVTAIAFRLKQAKFTSQFCDVLVDSKIKQLYLAIECKSTKNYINKFYLSVYFKRNQIVRFSNYIEKSGRNGFLYIKYNRKYSFIPWDIVKDLHTKNIKKLNYKIIEKYTKKHIDFINSCTIN